MLPFQNEDDLESLGAPPPDLAAPMPPAQGPPAPSPLAAFNPAALNDAEDGARSQRALINAVGGIGDSLSNRQGFGNFFLGKMNPENHSGRETAKAIASDVESPLARQAKLYESYMNAKKMQTGQKEDVYNTALDDPNSPQSKAAKAVLSKTLPPGAITPEMSGTDALRLGDPKKMNEISAQSAIDYDKQSRLLNQGKDADMEKMRAKAALDEAARLKEIEAKRGEGMTEGRKAVDRDFAKEYNDWNSGGRAAVDKNLQRLRTASAALGQDDSLTGPIVGSLPDAVRNLTNEKAITTRDDVRAAAQGALKATLGAQFTEREGERIMNQAYNPKLSPVENQRKIQLAVDELQAKRDAMEGKSRHFQQHGTLTGFDGTDAGSKKTVAKTQRNPRTGETRLVYTDGTTEIVPSSAGN